MRFPAAPERLGLGIGLDLSWGASTGFVRDPVLGDQVAPRVRRFVAGQAASLSHFFVSFQPRDRSRLLAADYFAAFDDLFSALGPSVPRALHHTLLNLGALEPYDRSEILELTNQLIERYGFLWVNEDLALWSLLGHSVPYPLPPVLTETGVEKATESALEVRRALCAPLALEFPGFSEGSSLCLGGIHAYDFFRRAVQESGSLATLDVGHLLSYQWFLGRRGPALFEDLERLPLEHCFEIHLSGCAIADDRFLDLHHGVLLDQQLELFERLVLLCPNLRAVTYEDPAIDAEGDLAENNRDSHARLASAVGRHAGRPERALVPPPEPEPSVTLAEPDPAPTLETELHGLLFQRSPVETLGTTLRDALDPEQLAAVSDRVREHVMHRCHVGSGGLLDVYPRTIASWREQHPDDPNVQALFDAFLCSTPFQRHRELPGGDAPVGLCLEEAFYRFCEAEAIGGPSDREEEFLAAMMKALLISPRPAFLIPDEVCTRGGTFFAVGRRSGEPVLYAASGGRLIQGPITPFVAELFSSSDPFLMVAARHQVGPRVLSATLERLQSLGLSAGGEAPP